jgi:hypothetical protein
MARVIITRKDGGVEFGIELKDFRTRKLFKKEDGTMTTYADAGFRIVSYADGQPYQQPAPKAEG